MCGRAYRKSDKQTIAERMRVKPGHIFPDPLPPDYNIAPTSFQPIVRMERENVERELVLVRWGMIPFFAKSLADFRGFSTINARSETIAESRTYRDPFLKRRGLWEVDGYYEWKALDDSKKPKKQPYAFSMRSGQPFSIAVVWDAWKDPGGAWLQSFSALTTEANELAATVHDRMPVIVEERNHALWLDREVGSQEGDVERLQSILKPFDADLMAAAPCNPDVGNVRNNGPEMLVCPVPESRPLNSA